MSLKLYCNFLSEPSRSVALFLRINDIPHENYIVDLGKGEHFSEEYEKMNPLKKVPIIVDNGFILRESIGILRYLCREKNVPDHWYTKDSKQQARVDEFLEWQHVDIRANCAMFFQFKFLFPIISGKLPNMDRVNDFEKRMKKSLGIIENFWLKNTPYLTGNQISIADLVGTCEIEQPRMAGYDARTEFPKVAAWMERVREDLNPHYDEVHRLLNKISQTGKLEFD